ncbi:MAG: hypothetical protein A2X22_07605 [Bacteroidetes bacterium GWF2_49_14]|nr:MAG: hypothetical protein A2X22_07605 [Bacteroidetes bacterium GWF2_49_14]
MMGKNRKPAFIVFLLTTFFFRWAVDLYAQDIIIPIEQITISGYAKSSQSGSFQSIRIDSLQKGRYAISDLATLLKSETNINVTQYGGEGSLSSIRLRGSGPSHTQVNWNGIPINSPTTGSIDLSLVSSLMADEVELIYGASGSLFGSGTFGGSLNLINKPDWNNRLSFMIFGEAGSWNHYKTGVGVRTGNDSWQYHAGGYLQSSRNNYTYRNTFMPGSPVERRTNDTLKTSGFQQHLFLRLPRSWSVQAGMWLQDRDKDLPAAMSSGYGNPANQQDQSFRLFTRISKIWKKSVLEIVGSRFADSLLYTEYARTTNQAFRQSGLYSGSSSAGLSGRWYPSNTLTFEAGSEVESQKARGSSFTGIMTEYRGAAFGSARYKTEHLTFMTGLRQVLLSGSQTRTLYSLSARYEVPGINLLIRGQASNKFRLPTLNERFWQPGGNPSLLPETGTGVESGLEWGQKSESGSEIQLSTTFFFQDIHNWVQWVPSGTYWSPENIRFVRCQGFEASGNYSGKIGAVRATINSTYSFTESLDMNILSDNTRLAGQIPYVPRHQVQSRFSLAFRGFEGFLSYRFTGSRYTTDDHDPWLMLKPIHIADFSMSHKLFLKENEVLISFRVNNLLNHSYQLIRAYPAPGRSFLLSMNYMFNQKSKIYADN